MYKSAEAIWAFTCLSYFGRDDLNLQISEHLVIISLESRMRNLVIIIVVFICLFGCKKEHDPNEIYYFSGMIDGSPYDGK